MISQHRPTKGTILARLNDGLQINLLKLIEAKNAYIALCQSQDDAVKLNTKEGKETITKLGLSLANPLAFEARKAIVARNFNNWITSHTAVEIQAEFNDKYPDTPCTKVIIMGKYKKLSETDI